MDYSILVLASSFVSINGVKCRHWPVVLEHVLVVHDTDYCVRTFLRRWYTVTCVTYELSPLGPRDAKVTSLGYLVKRGKGCFGFLFCVELRLVGGHGFLNVHQEPRTG